MRESIIGRRRLAASLFGASMLALLIGCFGDRPRDPSPARDAIVVFAAASTADVLEAIVTRFTDATGTPVTLHAAATSTLATQLRAGARADLFLSADRRWMDEVAGSGLLLDGTRHDLLANELVIVGPTDAPAIGVERGVPPAAIREAKRVAIADPELVPAGRYARSSLTWLGWWEVVGPKLVTGSDVRATLRLVEMGEAELGIVYATDALGSRRVRRLATLPPESHEAIVYPVALTRDAGEGAVALIEYLAGDDARRLFETAGFRVIASP